MVKNPSANEGDTGVVGDTGAEPQGKPLEAFSKKFCESKNVCYQQNLTSYCSVGITLQYD